MEVSEADLPGVGKKFEIRLRTGAIAVVVVHNTGKRDLYRRKAEAEDGELIFSLRDAEARALGVILEGAYFQPVKSDDADTQLSGNTHLDWAEVEPNSSLVGEAVDKVVADFDVEVLLVQRGEELFTGNPPAVDLDVGDVIVVAGDARACERLDLHAISAR